MKRRKSKKALDWDAEALAYLSSIEPTDKQEAVLWWQETAPVLYAAILQAGLLDKEADLPQTEDELNEWLIEYYSEEPTADFSSKRERRNWWRVGILFFFIAGRYYMNNRPVSWRDIRGGLDATLDEIRPMGNSLCQQLRNGEISVAEWQTRMANWIKLSHISAAALARGGIRNMTDADWDLAESSIRFQVEKLGGFANEIANGLPLDGNVCRRITMYLNSARGTYHYVESRLMAQAGYDLYRNVLAPAENCDSCEAQTNRGLVPIGDLVPIGNRDCLSNCLCHYEYYNSQTGQYDLRD